MGADNICIKDMANLLLPYDAYSLVKKLKAALRPTTLVHLHTHNTTGTGDMVNLKAIEAGCDIVDCALSPMGNGTAQPATEALVATLKGTEYDTGIDLEQLTKATDHFRGVATKLKEQGILDPKVLNVDVNTLKYQVPGGMLSNLINQLKQAGKSDKLYEVLAEVPRVREDFGYPPLVTPTSQIVGTQAVMNVITGERYKMNPKESQGLMAGEYGTLPAPVNETVRKKVIGNRKVITSRPVDDPTYGVKKLAEFRKEIGQYITQEEDVLSYALFPQVAEKFFQARQASQLQLDNSVLDKKNNAMPI
jgi:oxaloacetate decarboxylase alpha subunit